MELRIEFARIRKKVKVELFDSTEFITLRKFLS